MQRDLSFEYFILARSKFVARGRGAMHGVPAVRYG